MNEEPTEMQKRLAAADALPVETDAPQASNGTNPVPYDPGLQQDLLDYGPDALKEFGVIVVRDVQRPERYNSALWYALGHDLNYELREGCVYITDPKGAA